MARIHAGSIDEFIDSCPPETQRALTAVRELIHATAPTATETISYGMPTFDLNGRHLVHFAGHRRHIGFYPTPGPIVAFADALRPYKHSKGAVQFPLGQPIPVDLIRQMVEFRIAEVTAEKALRPRRARSSWQRSTLR